MTPIAISPTTKNSTKSTPAPHSRVRRRRSWSPEQKADYLAQFAASGTTAEEFCRDRGLSSATFSGWRHRRQTRNAAPGRRKFAEVRIETAAPSTATSGVTLHCPGGISLIATPGIDPIWLGRLVQVLR